MTDRRSFIKTGCIACLGLVTGAGILQGCKSVAYASGELTDDGLLLPLRDFRLPKDKHRNYVIVRHDALQYPICVYRISDTAYSALWMQCSHQGAELQASGDRLTCPAHGSEFDQQGNAVQGPAAGPLRNFPVTLTADHLFIDLRKQA